jgi:hypothetical protein
MSVQNRPITGFHFTCRSHAVVSLLSSKRFAVQLA